MFYALQHYMNSHADKKFSCSSCGLRFGQQRQAVRHEKACNLRFLCAECGAVYQTRDGLRSHCKRHGHTSGFSSIHRWVVAFTILSSSSIFFHSRIKLKFYWNLSLTRLILRISRKGQGLSQSGSTITLPCCKSLPVLNYVAYVKSKLIKDN